MLIFTDRAKKKSHLKIILSYNKTKEEVFRIVWKDESHQSDDLMGGFPLIIVCLKIKLDKLEDKSRLCRKEIIRAPRR